LPAAVQETLQIFWESPFPATLQDEQFRLLDVNDAYLEFSGFAREALVGRDPIELQPEEGRTAHRERRRLLQATRGRADAPALSEGRLVDAGGFQRWYRAARRVLEGEGGRPLYFAVLQDTTSEHPARERADRSVHPELGQRWLLTRSDVTPRRVRPRHRAGFAAGATAGSRRRRQAWPEL
jgi:PAS domain S-box-containing protein